MRPAALVVMAKAPSPGSVKTRLCPPMTPDSAAGLYRAFLLDVLERSGAVADVERYLFVDPPASRRWFQAVAPGYRVEVQSGPTLGRRLVDVFQRLFAAGHERVVVRNSDSPDLPAERITEAVSGLADYDLVLGPDQGGGYYLVGLRTPQPALFLEVPMSSEGTRAATLRAAANLGLAVHLLSPWLDVDRTEDLDVLRRRLETPDAAADCPRTRRFLEGLSKEA